MGCSIVANVRSTSGVDVDGEQKILPLDLHSVSYIVEETNTSYVSQFASELIDHLPHPSVIGICQCFNLIGESALSLGDRASIIWGGLLERRKRSWNCQRPSLA